MSTSFRLSTRRFGELLIERGRITPDQLTDALKQRQDPKERLGQTLVRLGIITEREVVELLAQQFSLPIASAERPIPRRSNSCLSTSPARPDCWR